jgi:hypothetical protein
VQQIKVFVSKILAMPDPTNSVNDDDDDDDHVPGSKEPFANDVANFLDELETKLSRHPMWRGCSPKEWTNALEGLEKFVMHKIYPKVFAPTQKHRDRDEFLARKLQRLQGFVTPQQLDLKPELAAMKSAWLVAGEELVKINEFRAPRDKLVCFMNCCRIIGDVLGSAAGAR